MSDLPGQTTGTGGPPPGAEQPAYPQQQQPQPVAHAGGPSGPRANFGQRLLGLIIDGLVMIVPFGIFFAIFDPALAYLLGILAMGAYFVVLEGGATGQTLGMKALSIRVVDMHNGGPIGAGRATVRALVQFFLSGILYLGYLWMLWDKEKQTWHDKASSSVVVPTSAYPIS
jgi:uncharacterized RDD family membrane protein YckC